MSSSHRVCARCGELRPLERFEPRRRVCRDCVNAARRASGRRSYTSERHRRYTYGLRDDEYRSMVARQGGRCAVCARLTRPLYVDHDHRTGKLRGLLCDRCNRAIGHLQDSPGVCRAAAEYLRGLGLGTGG